MRVWFYLIVGLLIIGCGSSQKPLATHQHLYTVKVEEGRKTLYFTGTLAPLHETAIISPMDAVIVAMSYHYGQSVDKNTLVFTLKATDIERQYNETLTDYLKAKDSFTMAQSRFAGTRSLWKEGLIAKNNYLSEKSSVDTARVTLMQTSKKLMELMDKFDDEAKLDVSQLKLSEFDKIQQALSKHHSQLHLKSPASGLLLYPPKSQVEKSARLSVGSSVKSGQVIALMGDMRGISVEIDISEIDVGHVRPGMPALIRSPALGELVLSGKIVAVNAQAQTSGNGGLPSFSALVEVAHLTPAQQLQVKVGMSANVELNIIEKPQLHIPITALHRHNGQYEVQVKTPSGVIETRVVTTASASRDKVAIISGLHDNEDVIL